MVVGGYYTDRSAALSLLRGLFVANKIKIRVEVAYLNHQVIIY